MLLKGLGIYTLSVLGVFARKVNFCVQYIMIVLRILSFYSPPNQTAMFFCYIIIPRFFMFYKKLLLWWCRLSELLGGNSNLDLHYARLII